MKILFLPYNMASMPALTAGCLNRVKGVQAKLLVSSVSEYQTTDPALIHLPNDVSKRTPLKWIWHRLTYKRKVFRLIDEADVLHFTWGTLFPDGADLKYARAKNKKIFVEWVGSELRNPELLGKINPYYKRAFENGYEYASFESPEQSERIQRLFAEAGATPLLCAEMSLYLDRKIFPHFRLTYQRLNVREFRAVFPSPTNKRPLLFHAPTAKVTKGSAIIIAVLEKLAARFDFDFFLAEKLPRETVLQKMREADIFIDQVIIGGYGMAAMEAMSLGKPVVTFVLPEVFAAGLDLSCPIVNANPDTLEGVLEELLADGEKRFAIGKAGRAFAEKFHDVEKNVPGLLEIYRA